MDELNTIASSCGVRFQYDRVVNSVAGLIKTVWSVRKIAPLVVLVPLNVYAAAERFPGVQVQLADAAGFVESPTVATSAPALDAVVSFESPVSYLAPAQAEAIAGVEGSNPGAEATGGNLQGKIVNQELASLDVVDTGVLNPVQNPQPATIVSRKTASLEVVDTGTTRQVQNPQPVEAVAPEIESPAVLESAAVNATQGEVDGEAAANYEVMLPLTGAVEKTGRAETTGNAGAQEVVHLPYAVLLAILALMSMIPVARRKE